jgi:hypothetical protein
MNRKLVSCTALTLTAAAVLVAAPRARAALTPEQQCQKGRHDAAGKYAKCELTATRKFLASGDFTEYQEAASKCRVKYTDTWLKLRTKASATGSTCDNPRFLDFGNAVVDLLTGLTWEKKDSPGGGFNFANPHDADNPYSWNAVGAGGAADGTAFTGFLPSLNTSPCTFTGYCDWRLPTRAELQTILSEPYPCTTSPCIDPIFGPTVALAYWSATTYATGPTDAWSVGFGNGFVSFSVKSTNFYVRAVRGGL